MPSEPTARHSRLRVVLACAAAVITVASLAPERLGAQKPERWPSDTGRRFYQDDPLWTDADMRDIPPVAEFDLSKSYEFVNETFSDTVRSHGPALNVNTVDEVPDSSWFTNRLGRRDMTIGEVLRGPDQNDGPAPGTWYVTGRPDAGITPKFTIKDARGDVYLIKLDPADFSELPSSVELISTKIFHAIGYHVPEDFLVTFDASRLDVAPGARLRTATGDRRPITRDDVTEWLKPTPRRPDGSIRALASRYVPGTVVGQFRYTGTRPDDPNDLYPHERRRELRGLRVFAAWLNHDDARAINSIDTYVEENGRRYVRHYLQDFGSNLGSGSTSAQQPRGGYEYLIEGGSILKGLFSFGLWNRGWTKVQYPDSPALGNIEADFFEPWKWKTEYPQPAFDQMDAADAFWAARIASRFSDEAIRAIVEAARLSDPADERFLADVIIRRRDKVVAYWIGQTNPLDAFAVRGSGADTRITFDNAAIRVSAARPGVAYKVQWAALDNERGVEQPIGAGVTTQEPVLAVPQGAWGPADASGSRYAIASIQSIHADFPHWASPVHVTVRNRKGDVDVVGIERPTGATETH